MRKNTIKSIVNNLFDRESPSTDIADNTDDEIKNDNQINNENKNEEKDEIAEGSYRILDTGAQKYEAINESGCEFDFSSELTLTSVYEIYKRYGNEAPVVLITSSHQRESYSNGKFYSTSDKFYDDTK